MISPWDWSSKTVSPNGKYIAEIKQAMEIAMGAPTRGDLSISNGIIVKNCNPSMVWSDNSKYLAIPQWTHNRKQKLLVIDIEEKKFSVHPGIYRVLQLETFDGNAITGIDSPIHKTETLSASLKDFIIVNRA